MGRKLLFVLTAFAVMFFGFINVAQAARHHQRNHQRRNRAVVEVMQGALGDIARDLNIEIMRMSRRGKMLRRPNNLRISATVPGGGSVRWARARFGRVYAVKATDALTGEVLLNEAFLAVRGFTPRALQIQGISAPVDPRIAQIAQMEADIVALQAQLDASDEQNSSLLAQLEALINQINALQAQIDAGIPASQPVVTRNSAFVDPVYVSGSTQVRVASFLVSAGNTEGMQISSLNFDRDTGAGLNLQNLTVMVGGVQFGSTRAVVATEGNLAFSNPSPVLVGAGGSVVLDLYADILSTSGDNTYTSVFDIIGWTVIGGVSGSNISFPAPIDGQNIILVDEPTLTVSDWSSLLTHWVLPGTTGNRLSSYRITADNASDIVVDTVVWSELSGLNSDPFASYYMYDGMTQMAGPISAVNRTVTFNLTNYVVPRNGTREIVLVGTAQTLASGGFSAGQWIFATAPSDISARAVSTNAAATVTGNLTQTYFVYTAQTLFAIGGGTNGETSNRSRSTSVDRPFVLSFTTNAAGNSQLTYLKLAFTGASVPSSMTASTVDLVDTVTGSNLTSSSTATMSWDSTRNAWVASFTLSYTGTAGTIKQVFVQLNPSGFVAGGLAVHVIDQTWNDGSASFGVVLSSPFSSQTIYE